MCVGSLCLGMLGLVLAMDALDLHAELAGEDGVEDDAGEGGKGEATEVDGAYSDAVACSVLDANGDDEDEGGNEDVAAGGEVDTVLDEVADSDSGDHAIEDEADATNGGCGHEADEACELRTEAEDDGEDGGEADDGGVEDAGEVEDAGVLAIGGVGRGSEEAGNGGGKAVAGEGAVESGILEVVLSYGR